MKHIFCVSLLLFLYSSVLFSQSTNENYTMTIAPQTETTIENLNSLVSAVQSKESVTLQGEEYLNETFLASKSIIIKSPSVIKGSSQLKIIDRDQFNKSYHQQVIYFDGFGKEIQSVIIGQNPFGNDVVQHYETDEFGRTIRNYLPIPINQKDGNFVDGVISKIENFYKNKYFEHTPFSEIRYDNTPLNKILETSSPGNDFQILLGLGGGNTKKHEYGFNTDVRKITKYFQNESGDLLTSYYENYELLKTVVKNENWKSSDGSLNTKEVYKDKRGKIISEINFIQNNTGIQELYTNYVYDYKDRLVTLISPKGSNRILSKPYSTNGIGFYPTHFITDNKIPKGGEGEVFQLENQIKIKCEFYFNFANFFKVKLKLGKILFIHEGLPNIELGEIGFSPNTSNKHKVFIKDGFLCVRWDHAEEQPAVEHVSMNYSIPFNGTLLTDAKFLDEVSTQYQYDDLGRQIGIKLPGKSWEYRVYDNLDRVILIQNSTLKKDDYWLFTKYDAYGREIIKGVYYDSRSRDDLQSYVIQTILSSANPLTIANCEKDLSTGYTNVAFPTENIVETLTIQYYDKYRTGNSSMPSVPLEIEGQKVETNVKGLLTSTWIKTIGTFGWTTETIFYDTKGRKIQHHQITYPAAGGYTGYTITSNKLNFRGDLLKSKTKHTRGHWGSKEIVIDDRFEYDNSSRLVAHFQKINNQNEEMLFKNEFDESILLKSKKVGGTENNNLQKLDYSYNIRGWLTGVNDVDNMGDDLFAYRLNYYNGFEGIGSFNGMYNGSVSQLIWNSKIDNIKKSYGFDYDKLNRLKKSNYTYEYSSGTGLDQTYNSLSEEITGYDFNGNILGLIRQGFDQRWYPWSIDVLDYKYDGGNKLIRLKDAGISNKGFIDNQGDLIDYNYDQSGNLIKDENKNISSIEYNYLDLIQKITFKDGKTIIFNYNGEGDKISKTYKSGSQEVITEYLGAFQYQNGQIQFFKTSEGYVYLNPVDNIYKYAYIYSDHLGNNRLSYSDVNGDRKITIQEILSSTDYYPTGMISNEYNLSISSSFNSKFQGKELQVDNNLMVYDFGARMYDSAIGRWFNPDPKNQFHSPYVAMGNNFSNSVDPDGQWALPVVVGAAMGVVSTAINNPNAKFEDYLVSAGQGALSGLISFGVGQAVAASGVVDFGAKMLLSAGLHGVTRGMTTHMIGSGNFMQDALIGAGSSFTTSVASGAGKITQLALGGLSGGYVASLTGGDFIKGMTSGLAIAGFNHLTQHIVDEYNERQYASSKGSMAGALSKHYADIDAEAPRSEEFAREMVSSIKILRSAARHAKYPNLFYEENMRDYGDTSADGRSISIGPPAFESILTLGLTILHEHRHAWHIVSGQFGKWENKYDKVTAKNISEYHAYTHEIDWGSNSTFVKARQQFYKNNLPLDYKR